jgi:hypothetical protein
VLCVLYYRFVQFAYLTKKKKNHGLLFFLDFFTAISQLSDRNGSHFLFYIYITLYYFIILLLNTNILLYVVLIILLGVLLLLFFFNCKFDCEFGFTCVETTARLRNSVLVLRLSLGYLFIVNNSSSIVALATLELPISHLARSRTYAMH